MAIIHFEGDEFTCEPGESVLECLERHGVAMASSCRSGVCQSCMMRVSEGAAPAAATKGLKETLRGQGYFLSCLCQPETDLAVMRADGAIARVNAIVESIRKLNGNVACLRLRPEKPIDYVPGQFANLVRPGGLVRSYSIASVPAMEDLLEFHVALMPGGQMSGWVHTKAQVGDTVELHGPHGQCFYVPGQEDQPLFLLGTGTGLAPLYGIVRDAIGRGHRAPIHLFHGSLAPEGLYLVEELKRLALEHEQFHYYPCALNGGDTDHGIRIGAVDAYALETIPDLKGWRVYLCGHPDMVKLMQRKVFLAGASMQAIFADAFLPSAAPVA
jgi:CDP-4-dehydro-6-deoxyglucose reductase, E3